MQCRQALLFGGPVVACLCDLRQSLVSWQPLCMPVSWPHFQLTPPYNPNCAGCIFHYDDEFTENSGKGFKEADKPNFTGSYYSFTKAMVESLLKVGGHTHRLQGARSA